MSSLYRPEPSAAGERSVRPRHRALRAALATYTSTDERERDFLARMLALLDEEGDAFSRTSFTPGHFTASAFVLSPDGTELFLIHHRKLGLWLQPGGHVEEGDRDVLAAARREVREEVGLVDAPLHPACPGLFDVDIHPIPARADEPAHEHFDVRFLFRAPRKDLVRPSAEVKGGRWVPLDEVADAGSDGSVIRAAAKVGRLSSTA